MPGEERREDEADRQHRVGEADAEGAGDRDGQHDGGNESSASMKRLTTSSIQPPTKPMNSPTGTPSTMATETASSEA